MVMELTPVLENERKVIENLEDEKTLTIAKNLDVDKANSFFLNKFGQAVNDAIDSGLKSILPDFIEDNVIEVKNALIQGGIKEATSKAIDTAITTGKEVIGGVINSVSDVKQAVKEGNLISGVSKAIDGAVDIAKNLNFLKTDIADRIKKGKDIILNTTSNNIDNALEQQNKHIEKLESYCDKWDGIVNKKDFSKIESQYKKIQKELLEVAPLVDLMKSVNNIENQYELLKTKNKKGEELVLTQEEKELCNNL